MKKVVKFGGSSLANAEQFQKVGDIIRSEESRRYVVPSAPGKRFDGDTKVTDLLYMHVMTQQQTGGDFRDRFLAEIKSSLIMKSLKDSDLALSLGRGIPGRSKQNFKAHALEGSMLHPVENFSMVK